MFAILSTLGPDYSNCLPFPYPVLHPSLLQLLNKPRESVILPGCCFLAAFLAPSYFSLSLSFPPSRPSFSGTKPAEPGGEDLAIRVM